MKLFIVFLLLLVSLFVIGASCVKSSTDIPEVFVMENSKGVVTFNHKQHSEAFEHDCGVCHHTGVKNQTCSNCHKEKKTEILSSKNAYHKTCKGCHKIMEQGPTKCGECHEKIH